MFYCLQTTRKTREFPPSLLLLCFLLFRKSPEASCFAPTSFLLFFSHHVSSCPLLLSPPGTYRISGLFWFSLSFTAFPSSSSSSIFTVLLTCRLPFYPCFSPLSCILFCPFLYFSIFSTILSTSSLLLSPVPPVLYIYFSVSSSLTCSSCRFSLFHLFISLHFFLPSSPPFVSFTEDTVFSPSPPFCSFSRLLVGAPPVN